METLVKTIKGQVFNIKKTINFIGFTLTQFDYEARYILTGKVKNNSNESENWSELEFTDQFGNSKGFICEDFINQ